MDTIQIVNVFKEVFSCPGIYKLHMEAYPYSLKSSRAVIRVSVNGDRDTRDRPWLAAQRWCGWCVRTLLSVFILHKKIEFCCLKDWPYQTIWLAGSFVDIEQSLLLCVWPVLPLLHVNHSRALCCFIKLWMSLTHSDIFLALCVGQCAYRFSDTFVWNYATEQ